MKKSLVLLCMVSSLLIPGRALSQEMTVLGGYGMSKDEIQISRAGVRTPIDVEWVRSISPCMELQAEVAYTLWKASQEKTQGLCLAPVFIYLFKGLHPEYLPYVEAGIGGAWVDDYMINGRNLSSNFLFEDRIGLGLRYGDFDFNFRYMHYSNASLKSPNDGIDIFMSTVSWRF